MYDLSGLTIGSYMALSGRIRRGSCLPHTGFGGPQPAYCSLLGGVADTSRVPCPAMLTCTPAFLAQAAPFGGFFIGGFGLGTSAETFFSEVLALAEIFFSTLTQCLSTPHSSLLWFEYLCALQNSYVRISLPNLRK